MEFPFSFYNSLNNWTRFPNHSTTIISEASAFYPVSLQQAKDHLRRNDTTLEDVLIQALIKGATICLENELQRAFCYCAAQKYLDRFQTYIDLDLGSIKADTVVVAYIASGSSYTTYDAANYQVDAYSNPARIKMINTPSIEDILNAVRVSYNAGFYYTPVLTTGLSANVFTKAAHGLLEGDVIKFTDLGTATGITTTNQYFVKYLTVDTFSVALTNAGTAVTVTYSSGTKPTFQHPAGAVPEPIKDGIKLLMSHLYEHRESVTPGQMYDLPHSVQYLTQNYSLNTLV